MYASIRNYSIKPGYMEEVMRRIQREFVFLISQEPDFLDDYALQVGPNVRAHHQRLWHASWS